MKQKRALTLLEIMIVIFLITIITGVIGYNMKGTLDKGKAFRTEQAREQLRDLLQLSLAEKSSMQWILDNPMRAVEKTGLAKNPTELLKDGWGEPFQIKANASRTDFIIESDNLQKYNNKNRRIGAGDAARKIEDED